MIRSLFLTLFLMCFSFSLFAKADSQIAAKVDQILAEANIHDIRPVAKALAKLGKPAVPYLIEKLNTYKHPALIVEALGRMGDRDAVLPLIDFLKKQNLTEQQDILLIKAILKTLSDLGDPRAESALLEIFRNEKNLPAIRLYAATSLAKIGSQQSKEEASNFILKSPLLAAGKISPIDLDTAYFELGTKEAMDKLVEALQIGLGYEQLFIVDLLAERISPEVNEILLKVAENKQYFPEVRLRAAEALVRRNNIPTERLLAALQSLRDDVPEESGRLVSKQAVQHLIDKVLKGSKKYR
jgi:HEAT repeat protein